jgi:hypothetical protein
MATKRQQGGFTLSHHCLKQLREVWNGIKGKPPKSADDLYARLLPVLKTVNTELQKRGFTLPSECPEQFDKRLKANPPKNAHEFREQLESVLEKAEPVRCVPGFGYLEQLREVWSGLKGNPPKSADDLYARLLPVLETVGKELEERGITLPSDCPEQLRERLKANPPKNAHEFREQFESVLERATERVRRVPGFGCLEQLGEICKHLEANPANGAEDFYTLFLPVLDTALNKLIEWSEADDSSRLRDCASKELVDRLMSLTAQADRLMTTNNLTRARAAEFGGGDRRGARHPESPISLLAGTYLAELVSLADRAWTWRSLIDDDGQKVRAEVLDEEEKWIAKVECLPISFCHFSPAGSFCQGFNSNTWKKWAEVVYEKMLAEQDSVKVRRALGKMGGKKRLCQFKGAILKAIKSLSHKPTGMIRGSTKPSVTVSR